MINPLDELLMSRSKKNLDELEKLAGFSPGKGAKDKFSEVAGNVAKKGEQAADAGRDSGEDRHWQTHKMFAKIYDKSGRSFALFVGDLLDIMLSGPVQSRLVNEMIEDKINRMRKVKEAAAEPSTQKVKVQAKRNSKYDVNVGGEKRIFSRHFLKRKGFLAALFLDSEEFQSQPARRSAAKHSKKLSANCATRFISTTWSEPGHCLRSTHSSILSGFSGKPKICIWSDQTFMKISTKLIAMPKSF
jgi:hypothetical protein